MKGYRPGGGLTQRGLSVLVLLLLVAYGAHLAYQWLSPLVPVVIVLVVLGVVYGIVLGRRR